MNIELDESIFISKSGKHYNVYTLFIDGKKVGRCKTRKSSNHIWLTDVIIYKAFRGRGFANILLEGVLEKIKGKADFVILLVKKNNTIAIKLYEKFEFIREDFDFWDDYVYRKDLI